MSSISFENWFNQRYPKLAVSAHDGTLSPNELWLFNAVKEAYLVGQENPNVEEAEGLDWERLPAVPGS
jgi:hypothetical protein